ncbi:hypothetical protein ACJX0J_018378 [Zea mays]
MCMILIFAMSKKQVDHIMWMMLLNIIIPGAQEGGIAAPGEEMIWISPRQTLDDRATLGLCEFWANIGLTGQILYLLSPNYFISLGKPNKDENKQKVPTPYL